MRYFFPIALSAASIAASDSEITATAKRLRKSGVVASVVNHHRRRHLQEPSTSNMVNSVTEGPVVLEQGPDTLEQLQLIQTIIKELAKAPLPDGVDLKQVNVAVIITEVLQELGIDAAASSSSGGGLSDADMSMVVQEIINKASKILGVTTTTTTDATTTTPSCVCSPLSYTFTINLSQTCDTNSFSGNPGIGNTACQFIPDDNFNFSTLKVFDVQFLEVDTSGKMTVINQDDTYYNVNLSSGDTISFTSISAMLNPKEPLADQLDYVPGGVLLSLRARSEGSTTIVTNRVSWMYTNSCESLPTSVGDAMGWITLVSEEEQKVFH